MKTINDKSEKPKIQELENEEDLEALITKDVVKIHWKDYNGLAAYEGESPYGIPDMFVFIRRCRGEQEKELIKDEENPPILDYHATKDQIKVIDGEIYFQKDPNKKKDIIICCCDKNFPRYKDKKKILEEAKLWARE